MADIPPRPGALRPPRGSRAKSNAAQEATLVRRLMEEALLKVRPETQTALAKCFASPKTVLACLELLARLEGELP